ncbi:GAF domain-containing protein [Pelomonas sp. SE-A7]|uniref:GAF domain-containing protein n=1 Tax=Pelomonas sp. SE-A7 TaxID=3054953 RepID=UPI00259C94C9|nr:GAF domain-containing protein [Pelomonas sp. SE-A7]MDM4768373.1 MCP four helix bundle domain-containing protein [Pelomonas sp. SE-A7]
MAENKPSKLRQRLMLLVGLVLLLMTATGVFTLTQLKEVAHSADTLYKDRLIPLEQMRRIGQTFGTDLPAIVSQLRDGRLSLPLARQQLDRSEQAARRAWGDYLETYLVDAEKRLIQRAEPELQRGYAGLARLRKLLQLGQLDLLTAAYGSELRADVEPLMVILNELMDVQLQVGRREAEDSQKAFKKAVLWVSIMVILTAALGLFLAGAVLQTHREEQSAAAASRARVQRFYMALSQTNQLIVRNPESVQYLFDALCRICVETGHAKLAQVVMKTEDGQHERVACFGPLEKLMPGAPRRWRPDAPQAALCREALDEGQHAISNHAIADARTLRGLIPPGVEAMAAFPLRRNGQVVGALNLLAAEPDFFDEALTALLDEMAGDVSFALDNLDRDQARRDGLVQAQAERALFERLFNAPSMAAAVIRRSDGQMLEVNDEMCRRYGYEREQLLGHRMHDLHVGLVETDRQRFNKLLSTDGRVRAMEAAVRVRDGSLRQTIMNGELIDYRGEPCVLATSLDVTELRAVQAHQQQQ